MKIISGRDAVEIGGTPPLFFLLNFAIDFNFYLF
jgi:hypothetical protein